MKNYLPVLGLFLGSFAAAADPLPWTNNVTAARRDSVVKQRPILVRIGGEACPSCRLLEKELAKPELQRELAKWILVYLDTERDEAEARRFAVGPIPALRIVGLSGKVLAAKDGYLPEADFVAWLTNHFESASAAPDAALAGVGEPTPTEVQRVVKQFADRDAVIREAAVQRLLNFPAVARKDVLKAFREGPLVSKLTALDLLEAWKAPTEGLDPWRPQSVTAERLAALEEWQKAPLPELEPTPLTAAEQAEVEEDLRRMTTAAPAEATVLRERLARRGAVIRPLVLQAHAEAVDDVARQRLLALRYRLVSGAEATLLRPGLLERLSATDPRERHKGADELAKGATADNQPLLLELFSDPDPLVREISLRGLKNIGGKQATTVLVKLLDDPDPNVRAAVLKQLAEDAPEGMLNKIGDYIKREKDADLVVHAIRFLRELKKQAEPQLLSLLSHESWQVRAEAAEGLYKAHKDSHSSDKADALKLRKAMLPLLDDDDPFVVGRAVIGLQGVADATCVAPLAKAAEKFPQLTVEIVKAVTARQDIRTAARSMLQEFRKHKLATVRAAVIRGLVESFDDESQAILAAALTDEDSSVRIAGAQATLTALNRLRGSTDYTQIIDPLGESEEKPAEELKPDEDSKWDQWLAELAAGKHRPAWTNELKPPLQKMLAAEAIRERTAAAAVLLPLGETAAAVALLEEGAKRDGDGFSVGVQSLNWLRFKERVAMIRVLRDAARDSEELGELLGNFDTPHDPRLTEEAWETIRRMKDGKNMYSAEQALASAYFGNSYIYDFERIEAEARKRGVEALKEHAKTGALWERLTAIKMLIEHAPEEVVEILAALADDAEAPEELRRNAFPIWMAALAPADRRREAIAALKGDNAGRRKIALAYLSRGKTAVEHLPSLHLNLEVSRKQGEESTDLTPSPVPHFKPVIPRPPAGLDVERLKELAADSDPEVAAHAGYLLALSNDASGLTPLLAYWNSVDADTALDRLVYRALAVTDDAQYTPILRRIHARTAEHELDEMYWTIRIMGGPEALDLRQQIRKQIGVDSLQN